MNRKQRRELRKDKNLIRNLYAIIQKYLPELFNRFYNLTDTRNQSYVTYDMKVICVTRLFGLLCGLTSLSIISDDYTYIYWMLVLKTFQQFVKQNWMNYPIGNYPRCLC